MSEVKKQPKWQGPFATHISYEGKKDFDKYYLDVTEKEVFKKSGEVDPDTGEELGVIEKKLVIKKIDIQEYLESQRDTVGVDSYIKALALQGEKIEDYNTNVGEDIQDFSEMPDRLADVMLAGDKAKAAFAQLDPALKGGHTTIEGFLNSLSKDVIESYIKGKIEAVLPKKEETGGNE